MTAKTDNHDPQAKLDLRRFFLAKYHAAGPIDVLDCCQGGGVLWSTLREEFPVSSYWGLDLKPRKGRLKLDSVRVLQQPGWPQNVIDIDAYGSPWKHWVSILPNLTRPTTVFLTVGQVSMGVDRLVNASLGTGKLKIPSAISLNLSKFALPYLLFIGPITYKILEVVEAVSKGNARYLGVRLEPLANTSGQVLETPGRKPRKLRKELAKHV